MIVTTDLHIHSPYAKTMEHPVSFKKLSENAKIKGIDILGTGDCLHPLWFEEIKALDSIDEGTFSFNDIIFVLTSELETIDHVHHLLFFPSISSLEDFKERIIPNTEDIYHKGRPTVSLSSDLLAFYAKEVDALIGPAHIFDATTGLYSKYSSVFSCYKDMAPFISFVELGLGADTHLADTIEELHPLTFLTNSDTHNPHPLRLGREFTQFRVQHPIFSDLKKAIHRNHGNKPILNVGFPPEEGKYYASACARCHQPYLYHQARKRHWKCACGSHIKKGIKDIIQEKATYPHPQHPYHRPLYLSVLPLHEIITRTLNEQNPFTDIVTHCYQQLISTFGNEISILLDTPIEDISKVTTPAITEAINAFRNATIFFNPGGGGSYGSFSVPWEKDKIDISLKEYRQLRLNSFSS